MSKQGIEVCCTFDHKKYPRIGTPSIALDGSVVIRVRDINGKSSQVVFFDNSLYNANREQSEMVLGLFNKELEKYYDKI